MTDFKNLKQTMYSTPMDVRSLLSILEREIHDAGGHLVKSQPIVDQKIEQHIHTADGIIEGYLVGTYGETALANETPYFLGPITIDENTSPVLLRGVIVATTAITEQWLIRFTDTDTYEVIGTVSGAQGSGNVSTDFTSDNTDVQIKSEDWDFGIETTVLVDNHVMFGTYKSHKLIRSLSAKLAAADLIDALYSKISEESSSFARALRKQAMDLLKALIDEDSGVSLTEITSEDIEQYEAAPWNITHNGDDITDYGNFDNDYNPAEI